jgi:hypothetical protein
VSRAEGFTSPHLIRLTAVPLLALVNYDRQGMAKCDSKSAQGKERRTQRSQQEREDSEIESSPFRFRVHSRGSHLFNMLGCLAELREE